MPDPTETYDRIALAIGKVCYWWSALETITSDLCQHVTLVIQPELLNRKLAISAVYLLAENMEMRERITSLKALACIILPLKEFERLEKILNRIDNEIRPERNRYVHDIWDVEESKIVRAKIGARVVRTQAFNPTVKPLATKEYGSIEEVERFALEVESVWRELAEFDGDLVNLIAERHPKLIQSYLQE